jgi:hypothetical protein
VATYDNEGNRETGNAQTGQGPILTVNLDALPPIWAVVSDDGAEAFIGVTLPDGKHLALLSTGPDVQFDRLIAAIHEVQNTMRVRRTDEQHDEDFWALVDANRQHVEDLAHAVPGNAVVLAKAGGPVKERA